MKFVIFLMGLFADPFVYRAGSQFYFDINKEIIRDMLKSLFMYLEEYPKMWIVEFLCATNKEMVR